MTTSRTQPPSTDLVGRYLQAVGFWLPRAQKQDILAEISEDLHSQIEDRESDLGRAMTESEVSDLLKQRGRPILVAGQFLPQRSLIGPALYPIYVFVLKIVALCYVIPWLLVWFGILLFHRTQMAAHLSSEMHSLGTLWTIVFTQFGIITLVFAAIDRVSIKTPCVTDWDPRKLPKLKVETHTKRRMNALAGLVFGIFGLLWLLAIPNYPFLIIGPAAYFLKPAPHLACRLLAYRGALDCIPVRSRVRHRAPSAHMVSAYFPYRHDAGVGMDRQRVAAYPDLRAPGESGRGGAGRNPEYLHSRLRGYLGGLPGCRPGHLYLAGCPGDPAHDSAGHSAPGMIVKESRIFIPYPFAAG